MNVIEKELLSIIDSIRCVIEILKAKDQKINYLEGIIKTQDEFIKSKGKATKEERELVFEKIEHAIEEIKSGIK